MPAPRKTDNSHDLPLTMDFDGGDLIMVRGVSLNRMSSHRLTALAKELAKLNLAQELEIGRYKAEVEDLHAELDRKHSERLAAEVVERRDLFIAAALIGLSQKLPDQSADVILRAIPVMAKVALGIGNAIETARSEEQPS